MTRTDPTTASDRPQEAPARRGAVLAMTVCAVALVASEFLHVSLLTPIAGDLGVTEHMAGQGVAISGAFAVVTSMTIGSLTGRMDRKAVLAHTVAMAVSGALVALAPNDAVHLLGRALIGVVVGGFWSLSAATAIRLMSEWQAPRALAILNGGNALASVLAAPLGWWTWVARALPRDAEAGGGLMVAIIQLCIALGSIAGGLLDDAAGQVGTFAASAVVLLIAAGRAAEAGRAASRR